MPLREAGEAPPLFEADEDPSLDDLPIENFVDGGCQLGEVRIQYGTVGFCIEKKWLEDYLNGRRKQSTPEQIMDALWGPFRAAMSAQGIDLSTVHGLIGCFAVDNNEAARRSMFWRTGRGAPYQFLVNTLALVGAYARHATDPLEWPRCTDFDDFLFDVVRGKKPKSSVALYGATQAWCKVVVNVRGGGGLVDNEFGREFQQSTCDESDRWSNPPYAWPCNTFRYDHTSTPCYADPWTMPLYNMTLGKDPLGNPVLLSSAYGEPVDYGAVGRGCDGETAWADVDYFAFNLPPARLSWFAFVADYVMFLAQIAQDYGLSTGASDASEAAKWYARYALRLMSSLGKTIIHELGHIYMADGGHCSAKFECCFERSAAQWMCKVAGVLRMPWPYFYLDHTADPGDQFVPKAVCGREADGTACGSGPKVSWYGYRCTTKRTSADTRSPEFVKFCVTDCVHDPYSAATELASGCGGEGRWGDWISDIYAACGRL